MAKFESKSVLSRIKREAGNFWIDAKLLTSGKLPSAFSNVPALASLSSIGGTLQSMMDECHHAYGPKEKHIYVGLGGADPQIQGRGFGKKLMNQVGDIGDKLGMACYLECGGEKNKTFYEKFGYEVVAEKLLTEDDGEDCLMYVMVREPRMIGS